jgi:hypothetical protein
MTLTKTQSRLFDSLSRFGKVREGHGHITRVINVRGRRFMPSTFNSLVQLGLAWGHETATGCYVGRLTDKPV